MLKTDSSDRAGEGVTEDSSAADFVTVPRARTAARLARTAALALVLHAPAARTQTDEIQVYDAEIAAPGRSSLTWHNNFTLSGRTAPADPGGIVPPHALNGVPEW
jgi:hypothetical protein